MAINTYATLVAAIEEWLARDGDTTLSARIPDFITLAESKFNRTLFIPQMEKRATADVDTASDEPEFITLPSDFQTMRRVRLNSVAGKPRLEFLTHTQIEDYRYGIENVSGQPIYFSIVGSEMELAPTPNDDYTLEMVYRANVPALTSSNTTNWLLTLAPDLYLYGALLESSPYLRDDDRIAVWAAGMSSSIEQLNALGSRQSFDIGPSQVMLSGPTP